MGLIKDYLYCGGMFQTLAAIDKDFKESIEQISQKQVNLRIPNSEKKRGCETLVEEGEETPKKQDNKKRNESRHNSALKLGNQPSGVRSSPFVTF